MKEKEQQKMRMRGKKRVGGSENVKQTWESMRLHQVGSVIQFQREKKNKEIQFQKKKIENV